MPSDLDLNFKWVLVNAWFQSLEPHWSLEASPFLVTYPKGVELKQTCGSKWMSDLYSSSAPTKENSGNCPKGSLERLPQGSLCALSDSKLGFVGGSRKPHSPMLLSRGDVRSSVGLPSPETSRLQTTLGLTPGRQHPQPKNESAGPTPPPPPRRLIALPLASDPGWGPELRTGRIHARA